MNISYLHVFTYSERDNTEAAAMEGVVPANVRAKRSKMLRGLSVKKRCFYESQLEVIELFCSKVKMRVHSRFY
jgi:threonylcarbamoyladenosine tRNA methylthiotransferase MtaB